MPSINHKRLTPGYRQGGDDGYGQTGRSSDTPPTPVTRRLGYQEANRRQPAPPCPRTVPGFLAPLLPIGVRVIMFISKRESTIEELLSDRVMLTMLQHSRTTADDVRALLNRARERLAKASAADTSHASVASSELPAVGTLS
jgi:hypothetical protein